MRLKNSLELEEFEWTVTKTNLLGGVRANSPKDDNVNASPIICT